ncbi:transcriptional regulator (plasmid) [Diaphorobacter sp. HDW4B]|uniref:helix-turn-helix domain-containing protein n=1 Tax=Diaphorobacter sp. HDW4B TaxID=2714925 RepID=UPI00140E178D|nr:transcriptional regulator [Diaphorobacter sp. HDW4B]QIL74398.1 transcriptional regulator [Diaphorobacter sp. HDW4B]
MQIHPIRTPKDYAAMLKEVSKLVDLDPMPDTTDGERLDVLTTLVEAYERKHFPIEAPDPIEAIKFRMEQQGLEVQDLVPMIGQKNRVYEVLARKRPLSLSMIRKLHIGLGIPAEALIREPAPASTFA